MRDGKHQRLNYKTCSSEMEMVVEVVHIFHGTAGCEANWVVLVSGVHGGNEKLIGN